MLSLDEAITHCLEVAEENEGMCRVEDAMGLGLQNAEMMKCASEHRQLAEWLRELQGYKAERVCCEFCKYQGRLEYERPCSLCKHNFKDMFEREVKADAKTEDT